jgi:hypothetical protein
VPVKPTKAAPVQPAVQRAPPPPAPPARASAPVPFAKDALSTGKGKALATKGLTTTGATQQLPPVTSSVPTVQASTLQTGSTPPPPAEVAAAAKTVEAAYTKGGAAAAAKALADATAGKAPEIAAQINAAARPTVDQIIGSLAKDSKGADGDQVLTGRKQQQFDQTVADLSVALARGATTPVGKVELAHAAEGISTVIANDGIGRFDEALGNTVVGGPNLGLNEDGKTRVVKLEGLASGSSALTTAVISQLKSAGKTRDANDVLQNVDKALSTLNTTSAEINKKVEERNQDLAYLVQNFGPVLDPKELESAVVEFKKSHPEYAAAEKIGGPAIDRANELALASPGFKGLEQAKAIEKTIEVSAHELAANAANSSLGAASLATLTLAKPEQPTLLDRAAALAKIGKLPQASLSLLSGQLISGATASALAAKQAGDPALASAAFARLNTYSAIFGADGTTLKSITSNLDEVIAASDEASAATALKKLDGTLKKAAFSDTSGVSQAFRGAGFLLGVAGTIGSVDKAINDPNFVTVAQALNSAAGTGQAGVALAKSVFGSTARLTAAGAALKTVGTYTGVVTTGISAFQSLDALAKGDATKAGLYAAQAIGGALILAGSAGPGAVVVAGAAVALAQVDRVRASNRLEDRHTTAFLVGAGVPPEAAKHVRNADDNGRLVGDQIAALAGHLGVDPKALFDHVSGLPAGKVKAFITTLHGVNPDENGAYPKTAENDGIVGEPSVDPKTGGYRDTDPNSLQGIVNFLEDRGFDFSGLPKAP